MMRGVASPLEKHHRVQILDEAIEAAVRLSHRYIPARQLPDKAVSLLDTACARVADQPARDAGRGRGLPRGASRRSRPSAGSSAAKTRSASTSATRAPQVERSSRAERDDAGRARGALGDGAGPGRARSWRCARKLREGGHAGRRSSRPATRRRAPPDAARAHARASCGALQAELAELQGETPLILPRSTSRRSAAVVGDWTGIPVGRMVKNEIAGGAEARRDAGAARHRPGPRAGDDRPAHADLARRARQPEQADRRVHALRPLRRRQDRDRAGARRGALRRRAEPHHDQHERVPGGAHRLAR